MMSSPYRTGLSVLIPCYNGAAVIENQFAALERQDWDGDWEVVVADNGSTDDIADRVCAWQSRLPGLRLVDASHRRGVSAARNAAVRHARYDAFAFVDADDRVHDGFVRAMGEAAQVHDLFEGGAVSVGAVAPPSRVSALDSVAQLFADRGFLDAANGNGMGCSRRVFEAVGGFDESFLGSEDTAFSWEAQLLGYGIVRIDGAKIDYTARATPAGVARQQRAWGISKVQLYVRYRAKGMPRSNTIGALVRWGALIASAPVALASRSFRYRWANTAGHCWGRIIGSLRHRTLFL